MSAEAARIRAFAKPPCAWASRSRSLGRTSRVSWLSLPWKTCPSRGGRGQGFFVTLLGLLFALDFAGVHGVGERGPLGTRCLPEVLSVDGGRVVIYDTVVNVPMRRLFLIGPNKPLWVVHSVPEQQANTVTFSRTFNGRPNPDFGRYHLSAISSMLCVRIPTCILTPIPFLRDEEGHNGAHTS